MPRVPIIQTRGRHWRLLQSDPRTTHSVPSTFYYSQGPAPAAFNRTMSSHSLPDNCTISAKVVQPTAQAEPKPLKLANANFQTVLKWENDQYAAVQAFIVEQIKLKLDTGKGLRSQDSNNLNELIQAASSLSQITITTPNVTATTVFTALSCLRRVSKGLGYFGVCKEIPKELVSASC
ncbi:hypothetical protein CPB83DRAFT_909712 [Crepidotus variabilis]|uniref:Uncharacterized protein n=1 Tax=Crepidotus variabilis TaxID=179855 RepID=A0A9P6E8Z0_9AGAR|nr:hypothetical protein CPB83DRAFT_909712 [Crepidotus variabilis]